MARSLRVIGGLAKSGNSSGIVHFVGHQLRFFGLAQRENRDVALKATTEADKIWENLHG